MKTKLILTVIISAAVAFAACKKKKEDVPQVTPVAKKVYVAGYEESSSGNVLGRYWVDTSATVISEANGDVELIDIEVVGNDRYVFGETNMYSGPAKFTVWKNGTVMYEIPYNRAFVPTRMAVSGTDVYLCGNAERTTAPTLRPAIWKNGIVTELPQGYSLAYLNSIYVSGNTVYAAGLEYSSNQTYYSVWANGTRQVLNGAKGVSNVTVSGSDVYVAGGDDNNKPAYWKNGTKVVLPVDATSNGWCAAIKVVGTDVYACGGEYLPGNLQQAVYWKNGVKTTLASINASYWAEAYSLDVDGANVYICGRVQRNGNSDFSAALWKNNVLTNLTPAADYAEASSVIVR
jgi:uncharacterized lipoprotein YbaY